MTMMLDESVFSKSGIPKMGRKRQHSESSEDDVSSPKSHSPSLNDDRRAHHNELERRRRDHIKDHFMALKNAIPILEGEKSSRALILKRAIEYIGLMKNKINESENGMAELKRRNELLEAQLNSVPSSSPSVTSPVASISASSIPATTVAPTTSEYAPCSAANTSVPIESLILPAFRPTPIQPSAMQIPMSAPTLPTMDALRMNSLFPTTSQDGFMALAQLLMNPNGRFSNSPKHASLQNVSPVHQVPDLNKSILANTLSQQTPVQFSV
ncbi:unnamed protein product [Auanema sp. JU1783]|nr:unnamed protein product [Auanema sp. JU1783]